MGCAFGACPGDAVSGELTPALSPNRHAREISGSPRVCTIKPMTRAWTFLSVRIALAIALVSFVAVLTSQPTPREHVGPLPGGAFLLNSGWVPDPVGKQVPLDTLPMSSALSPDGKYLLVLNGGYRPPSITVIDTASANHQKQRAGGRS